MKSARRLPAKGGVHAALQLRAGDAEPGDGARAAGGIRWHPLPQGRSMSHQKELYPKAQMAPRHGKTHIATYSLLKESSRCSLETSFVVSM